MSMFTVSVYNQSSGWLHSQYRVDAPTGDVDTAVANATDRFIADNPNDTSFYRYSAAEDPAVETVQPDASDPAPAEEVVN